jgi:hypothetical protein
MQQDVSVCGVPIRISHAIPKEVIGMDNGRYTVLFWQGAELCYVPSNALRTIEMVWEITRGLPPTTGE